MTYDESSLDELTRRFARPQGWRKPVFYNPRNPHDYIKLCKLIATGNYQVVQRLDSWASTIAKIEVPHRDKIAERQAVYDGIMAQGNQFGLWVVIDNFIVQIADKATYFRVRSARNQPLRSLSEQKLLGGLHGVFIGQSVGSSATVACALEGICDTMTLVDFDPLDPSNLNRIGAGIEDIGDIKTTVTGRRIARMNPYITQHHFTDGATFEALEQIFALDPLPSFIVEAIDSITWKDEVREWAKRFKIPVFMPTDIGRGSERVILVDRYDNEENVPLFDGDLSPELMAFLSPRRKLTWDEMGGCAIEILGDIPPALAAGLLQVHYTLAGIPQLGGTATIGGVVAAWSIEAVFTGRTMPSGWYTAEEVARIVER